MYVPCCQDKVKDCTIGCGLCTCKFSRSTSLYRHLRNHALKKDLMPHLCSFCQVGFLDTYSLYLHASTEHHAASVIVNESKKVFIFLIFQNFVRFLKRPILTFNRCVSFRNVLTRQPFSDKRMNCAAKLWTTTLLVTNTRITSTRSPPNVKLKSSRRSRTSEQSIASTTGGSSRRRTRANSATSPIPGSATCSITTVPPTTTCPKSSAAPRAANCS